MVLRGGGGEEEVRREEGGREGGVEGGDQGKERETEGGREEEREEGGEGGWEGERRNRHVPYGAHTSSGNRARLFQNGQQALGKQGDCQLLERHRQLSA